MLKTAAIVLKAANGSMMVVQWGVTPSVALHPVPVCVLDRHLTLAIVLFGLTGVQCESVLAGSLVVLHVCCSTVCPRVRVCAHVLLCVRFEEDKHDMINDLK